RYRTTWVTLHSSAPYPRRSVNSTSSAALRAASNAATPGETDILLPGRYAHLGIQQPSPPADNARQTDVAALAVGGGVAVFTRKAWKVRLTAAGVGLVGVSLYIGLFKLPGEKAQYEALHSGREKLVEGKITQKWTREGRRSDDHLVRCE